MWTHSVTSLSPFVVYLSLLYFHFSLTSLYAVLLWLPSDLVRSEGGEGVRDDKVEGLLAQLGLEKYAELFQCHEIGYDALLSCTDDDLKRIGMT